MVNTFIFRSMQAVGEHRVSPFGTARIVLHCGSEPGAPVNENVAPHLYKTWKPILEATGHTNLLEYPEDKGKLASGGGAQRVLRRSNRAYISHRGAV